MRFRSIESRIATTFSLVLLVTILTFILISYRFSFEALRSNSLDYTGQLVQQVGVDVDGYIKYMQDISLMVALNKDIEEYFSTKDVETFLTQYLRGRIQQLLNSISLARTDITNLILFCEGEKPTVTNKEDYIINKNVDPRMKGWYQAALKADGEPVISSSHVQNVVQGNYTYVISLSRLIKTKDAASQNGVVLVDLNYARISDLCRNISLGKKGYIFIVDENGDIVYHPQQQLIYSGFRQESIDEILTRNEGFFEPKDNKDGKIYTIRKCKYPNWTVVGVMYVDELVADSLLMQRYYFFAAILFIPMAMAIAYYLAHRISKPIMDLETSMIQFEQGDFDARVAIESDDEVGKLAMQYNIMTARIKELVEQNLVEHELKRKTELKVLQSQINPHFLYNTLDSIIWMAESGLTDDVILMTSSLARLFRISISKGSELITVRNELEYIKSYLTIQEMRYKDKFTYDFDIDEPLMSAYMLKLLLQPLVENAIYHGIKNIEGAGTIAIKGYEREGKAYLEVSDTGAGMSAPTLKKVNDLLENPTIESMKEADTKATRERGSGVGIANVNQRLKLYFGEEYGLSFTSGYHKGTTATIVMPILNQDKTAGEAYEG